MKPGPHPQPVSDRFWRFVNKSGPEVRPGMGRSCVNCGREAKIRRRDLCGACSEYLRRNVVSRPIERAAVSQAGEAVRAAEVSRAR